MALVRLTRKSGLYPQRFNLKDVALEDPPIVTGLTNDVHKGTFRGQVVCVKVVKTRGQYDEGVYTVDPSRVKICVPRLIRVRLSPGKRLFGANYQTPESFRSLVFIATRGND